MSNQINEGAARYKTDTTSHSREGGITEGNSNLPVPSDSRERQNCPSSEGGAGATCHSREGGNPLKVIDHLDLWTSTVTPKSTSGRGRGSGKSSKLELTGIKKLRELILELAVRGKLVAQNPDDEPASKLLERIEAEKVQLIKDGKLKKQKPLAAVTDDEQPFELPEGWECERLGNLVSKLGSGSTPRGGKTAYVKSGIPFLRSQNIWNDGLALDDIAFIPKSTHESMSNTVVFPGDILLNITGASLGRSLVFPDTFNEANVSQHVTIIRLINARMTPFMSLCIKSPLVQSLVWGRQVGMAIEGLSKKVLERFEMPIPPLAEQQRIVAKVDELMALCDQLEQQSEHQLTAHQQLTDTLLATLTDSANAQELNDNWQRLAQHFDLLFSGPMGAWAIDRLKDTILQLAVMGKLVPQNPDDEPASKLLKRIEEEKARLVKEGKIKKTKKLPPVSDEEKPFELPEGWEWVRLNAISNLITDGTHHTPTYVKSGVPFLSVKDMSSGDLNFNDTRYITKEEHDQLINRCHPEYGDLLLTKVGTTGVPVLIDSKRPFSIFVSVALIKFPQKLIYGQYLKHIFNAPVLTTQSTDGTEGVGNKNLVLRKINMFKIPTPPLAEQQRIVAKVDELFALCDQLKDRLQQASETEQHMTNAIVEQALS